MSLKEPVSASVFHQSLVYYDQKSNLIRSYCVASFLLLRIGPAPPPSCALGFVVPSAAHAGLKAVVIFCELFVSVVMGSKWKAAVYQIFIGHV
jgi:hypothetical protein